MTRRRGRPWPQGVSKKLRSEKLRAEFSFPKRDNRKWPLHTFEADMRKPALAGRSSWSGRPNVNLPIGPQNLWQPTFTCFTSSSGAKKEPKPKLLSPDIFWWGGGLPREGVGAKKVRYVPRNPGNQTFFCGISQDFAGISRKRPKSLRKKCLGSFFGPYLKGRQTGGGGFQTGGFPDQDLSFLFCPFLGLSRFFRDFPGLLGDGPGIFLVCPFSLSRPIKSTYLRNSPERVRDTICRPFPKKVGDPPVFGEGEVGA